MVGHLLVSISSYLHPPTAATFCLIYLSGFDSFSMSVSRAIDACHFLIELAACGEWEGGRMLACPRTLLPWSDHLSFFGPPG
jgi:hypothetical protein